MTAIGTTAKTAGPSEGPSDGRSDGRAWIFAPLVFLAESVLAGAAWSLGSLIVRPREPWTGDRSGCAGAHVNREAADDEKIVVDPGYAVDSVHYRPPNRP